MYFRIIYWLKEKPNRGIEVYGTRAFIQCNVSIREYVEETCINKGLTFR